MAQGPPPGMGGGKGGKGNNSGSGGGGGNNNSHSNASSYGVQNALRERFIGLTLNMVGQKVVITQTNGAVFEGIFHTFCPFASLPAATKNKYVIKACRVIKPPQTSSSEEEEADKDEPQVVDQATVIISADKVACLTAKSMRIDSLSASSSNGGAAPQKSGDGFRTDTEISGGKGGKARDFVAAGSAWTTGGTGGTGGGGGGGGAVNSRAEALMGGLGEKDKGRRGKAFNSPPNSGGLSGKIGEWDQFKANQELFNVNATFDENLYTTELDKTQMDNQKIAEAERLAREIENTPSANMHVAEERGQKVEGDFDEEDLYSGVLKDDGQKKPAVEDSKAAKGKPDNQKSSNAAPKKMNYAAAAAKADAAKKVRPPGFSPARPTTDGEKQPDKVAAAKVTPEKQPEATAADATASADNKAEKAPEKEQEGKPAKVETETPEKEKATEETKTDSSDEKKVAPSDSKDKEETAKDSTDKPASSLKAPSSKLNANAKEFTLNPTARTFTPGGPPSNPVPQGPEGHYVDPNAAMHAQVAHMSGPHYMHGGPMAHQPGKQSIVTV